jgi:histidinol-phosphate aminotransferase
VTDQLRHVHAWLRDAPTFAVGEPPAGMLRLDLNEGPYGPTPKALAALDAAGPALNRYPDPNGAHGLRDALAERLAVAADTLLFGSGSNSLQSLLIRIASGPGRKVAYSWPGFPTFGWAASRCGAEPLPVPTRPDGSDDLEALAAAAREAAVVVLATPNNPTGRVVLEGLEDFVADVAPHALVLLDEAYHEYAPPRVTGLDLFQAGHEVVVLRTFSKAWGLAGARIGYAVMAPALRAVARSAQDTFEVSAAAFEAARASLDDADVVAARTVENARVRAALEEHLTALGAAPWPSAANFVCAKPPDPDAFAARLAEHGILVRPTAQFGAPDRVRIGVPAEADLERVLQAITDALA